METNQFNENVRPEQISEFKKFMKSYTARILISVVIILMLMIPATQLSFLIRERKNRQEAVVDELKQEWGTNFTLNGLVLEIPKNNKSKDILYIFPETSNDQIKAIVNERYRGIFKANLFTAQVKSTSSFSLDKIRLNPENKELDWSKARLILLTGRGTRFTELSDFKADDQFITVANQSESHFLKSFTNRFGIDPSKKTLTINYEAEINGTESIKHDPTASRSTLVLNSNWMDPAFSGTALPENGSFKKKNDRMTASWKTLSHIGNGSQAVLNSFPINNRSFSEIKFITLLDQYQLNERTVKYALLVLTLTFAVFFMVQIVGKSTIHPVHYLLIGLALLLFYSLLLSLSEHLGFNGAYIVSASAIILLIVWYAKAILNSIKFAIICGLSLSLLYAFLLVLVNLEVYALLVGSIGLLIALASIMAVTRKLKFD